MPEASQATTRPPAETKRPGPSMRPSMKVERPTKSATNFSARAFVEILLRADLADLALAHHHEAVGHGQGFLLVVGHHHGGQAELALQFADFDPHVLAQLGVEIGQRLVEQQHVGPEHQRARQRHALLLAAG